MYFAKPKCNISFRLFLESLTPSLSNNTESDIVMIVSFANNNAAITTDIADGTESTVMTKTALPKIMRFTKLVLMLPKEILCTA